MNEHMSFEDRADESFEAIYKLLNELEDKLDVSPSEESDESEPFTSAYQMFWASVGRLYMYGWTPRELMKDLISAYEQHLEIESDIMLEEHKKAAS